ncbi:MAG: transcription termination/antitermination protein NusA [Candidatus Moraniibacteriota bacterium]|nr:MAG: transcription termination/antitermination protein NusA [Candidatus Moranbacteria bacterium]
MAKKKVVEASESESLSGRLGEFGSAVMQIAEEKNLPREKVFEIVEAALAAAYKKDYGKKGQVIKAKFDEVTKSADFFLVKEVVDETLRDFTVPEETEEGVPEQGGTRPELVIETSETDEERLPRFNAERDLTLDEAKLIKQDAVIGDSIEIPLESHEDFGRVAAQTAKQVIIQRIREAERETMFTEYKEKEGQAVNGIVQRIEGRNVFVDLGKSTGILFPSEQIPGENYRMGQHLKVFLTRVESDPKGPGLILSRAHPEMVRHLFTLEVPEIATGTVEIKAIAREAGSRTKIAVLANEDGVDPIGSCVGQKGTRVQTVIDELGGEKVDIIEWNEDVQKFISAALSPAKVLSVELREAEQQAIVTVPADQLSLAIGKRGQNVRLAAKLTGWRIDVKSPEEEEVSGAEVETETEALAENESITETAPEATEVTPISAEASPEAVAEEKE